MSPSNYKHLLIIGSVWPEPDSSAAGTRMMQLLQLFKSAGWAITFASPSVEQSYSVDLRSQGIRTRRVKINSASFDDFIIRLQPDMVMFDRFVTEEQFGWRVAEQCPQALRLLDTEDLHCLRRARQKAQEQDLPFKKEDLLQAETAKREIASIMRSDLSLIISQYEMKLLEDVFGVDTSLLYYLPFKVKSINDTEKEAWPPYEDRSNFATIGNFRHAPNLNSAKYLKRSIWPLIHAKLPQVEMHIYGAYPSQKAMKLHQPEEGFFIEGRADDAKAVMKQARVCLAPLQFGAGLKGKLVEAMQCGTPSITTPIGAEGLCGNMDWPGAVEDKMEAFARAAVTLYNEPERWQQAQRQGVKIINERFAKQENGDSLLVKLSRLTSDLETHRRHNFIGAMLRHHTMKSTEYMARWIEAKNKV